MMRDLRRQAMLAKRLLLLTLVAVIASFVTATAYSHYSSSRIDILADQIATNTSPSVQQLSAARTELRHIEALLEQYVGATRGDSAPDREKRAAIEQARRDYAAHVLGYLNLPVLEQERKHWRDVSVELDELDNTVAGVLALVDAAQYNLARERMAKDLPGHADRASEAIAQSLRINAEEARGAATEIEQIRSRMTAVAYGLDLLCACLAILLGVLLWRTFREYTRLVDAHRGELERRNSELEIFAGRVAHDIVSPLAAAASSLDFAERKLAADSKAQLVVAAGTRSVSRVKRIVDALLDFARAGARPAPDARAEPREVLEDVLEGLRPLAESTGVELVAEMASDRLARCSAGALTSVLSNLVANAIKYIGHGSTRVVKVGIRDVADRVRIEIADTGPGLPPGFERAVFDPYVRVAGSGLPGIGLGLATVRRIVDAHGGEVGVKSVPKSGCTFWIELPCWTTVSDSFSIRAAAVVH